MVKYGLNNVVATAESEGCKDGRCWKEVLRGTLRTSSESSHTAFTAMASL